MSLKSGSEKTKNNDYENNKTKNKIMVKKINQVLEIVLEENKSLNNYKEKLVSQRNMSFTSLHKPPITIEKYLERILNYTAAEESTIIIALIYIDRLSNISNVILTPYNIHKIIFAAILLSIKYNEDSTYDFEYYSEVAGISYKELKIIEFEFVCLLQFNLYVNKNDFDRYKSFIDSIDNEEDND